jgi:hypothetical protein
LRWAGFEDLAPASAAAVSGAAGSTATDSTLITPRGQPKFVMRVTVQDETDEGGKPRVNVVIAFLKRGCEGDLALSCPRQFLLRADEVIE